MNERVEPLKVKKPRDPRRKISRRDREFLPAALEILETPAPPLPVVMLLTICAFFAGALAWSFYGELDVHAVASGKVEVAGHAKVIQPLDPGKIIAVHVEEGARVNEGEPLLEFDPKEVIADEKSASDSLNASLAESQRRNFAVEKVRALASEVEAFSDDTEKSDGSAPLRTLAAEAENNIQWDHTIPNFIIIRELAVLRADLYQLSDTLSDLEKQMAQKRATRQRFNMSISFQTGLIETQMQRVGTRQEAMNLSVGTKINLYDAKEQLQKAQASLASDQGQLIETEAAIRELRGQKTKAVSQFIAENQNKASEAARKADESRQSRIKAEAKLSRTKLYSPINGTVQQLAVTTLGQVATVGQQLMVITPRGGQLQIEALVPNIDIGFIKVGQNAAVKIDAFPFTRFGVLQGRVISIAQEAVEEQVARRAMANATSSANNATTQPSSVSGQPQVFVFPVKVALEKASIKVGDTEVPLTPGMTVTVEINTQRRRVIDYFLSPLAKLTSEAFTER
jgi:hemolysin D